ncbi:hypothetical protein CSUI_009211 [Cystoisospora suis]|uniref:Secreted protein n=1 Tax=Cystoisospora suis TaxID=483139 RepID=A0A2C6KKR0_9APIC|nr:hypothetical protein CSUI_009211 [Cystoisospora suis]
MATLAAGVVASPAILLCDSATDSGPCCSLETTPLTTLREGGRSGVDQPLHSPVAWTLGWELPHSSVLLSCLRRFLTVSVGV